MSLEKKNEEKSEFRKTLEIIKVMFVVSLMISPLSTLRFVLYLFLVPASILGLILALFQFWGAS